MPNFIIVAEDKFRDLIAEIEALFKADKHPKVSEAAVPVKAAADAVAATAAPVPAAAPAPVAEAAAAKT